jgi:hypothetical protein
MGVLVMDVATEHELLTVVQQLSPRDTRLVIAYARSLQATPVGDAGQAYLEFLTREGTSPADLARAAQAVQRVEARYASTDPATFRYELEQRTEEQIRTWLSERGLDYDALTEVELDEIVNEFVQQSRSSQ